VIVYLLRAGIMQNTLMTVEEYRDTMQIIMLRF